jgi:predicted metal-binding membrane protein
VRRDRLIVATGLASVVALSWLYLWHDAAMMASRNEAARSMGLVVSFAMWFVMMMAMMLPAALPAVLVYGAMVRRHTEHGRALPAAWMFVSGYVTAWAAFSFAAVLVQAALERWKLLAPMLDSANQWLSGALLLAAGIYQWSPLKHACLSKCRNPVQFFITHWRTGATGALRMGLEHGAYCVGCCGVLMLLLFAVGVMNLLWIAVIAAFVFVEKLLPAGRMTAKFAGGALIVVGLIVLLDAGR